MYLLLMDKKTKYATNEKISDPRMERIAERLKELRIKAGYTNYENFAWEFEIGRAQYWRMEKGANFTMVSLLKILDAHKISLAEFCKDID
jgi:hypothetical protein